MAYTRDMGDITGFFRDNFVVIYFIYGLAFFVMGLAIVLESRRQSEYRLARAMLPLAGFGILHGLHEWFEMFDLLQRSGATNVPDWLLLEPVRIAHLVISFALLSLFGVRLIYANHYAQRQDELRFAIIAAGALIGMWAVSWLISTRTYHLSGAATLDAADVLARYTLGVPGALLAAWAIWLEQRSLARQEMPQFGRMLLFAALAILAYGVIGQTVTRPSPLFPSDVWNTTVFWQVTGLPIQLLRAIIAVIMAVAMIRALRIFEIESQQKLAAAQAARLTAQQEALDAQRQTRLVTEQLNQELAEAVRTLTALHTLARRLAATLDPDQLLDDVFPHFVAAEERIGAGMVLLRSQPDHPPTLRIQTHCPADPVVHAQLEAAALLIGQQVVETGQALFWDGKTTHPLDESAGLEHDYPVRILGLPIHLEGFVAGSLLFCTTPDMAPFRPRDISFLTTAARQFSVALHNAELYRQSKVRETLRGELLHRIVNAQEQERQRIARELHDGPGQTLTALGLGLAASAESIIDPPQAHTQLNELKDLSASALQEIHDIILDLRPSVLDDLGLIAALRSQLQLLEQRAHVRTQLAVNGTRRRLPPDLETIIFRIVQEALTNIAKHAHARLAHVKVVYEPDQLIITIEDDGQGFDMATALEPPADRRRAWGLLGMQERVALTGGQCTITSEPHQGTVIHVRIPLPSQPAVITDSLPALALRD